MFHDLEKQVLFVTGGAGFMGSCFIRHILALPGFEGKVINYDALTYSGNLDNLKQVEKDPRYRFINGNILNQQHVEEILFEENVSIIVHFAAETHVDRSIEDGFCFLKTNILGTYSLLEAVRKFPGVHFHHVSTDEVYGSLPLEGVFSEDSPYKPNSPYSASKAASDHLVRASTKTYNVSSTISHAGNNYGPYQYPEKLIPFMITRLINHQSLPLYGKGDNVRDWLFVEDHAKAIEMILRRGKRSEVYNIGGSKEMSNLALIKELIAVYAEFTQQDPYKIENRIVFVTDRLGHDFRYAMDTTKIRNETGWEPCCSFENGLKKTVGWYLGATKWLQAIEEKQKSACV